MAHTRLLRLSQYFTSTRTWQFLFQRFHSSSATKSTTNLPWGEILPFRSVKVDLASAWREGWRPQERQDFTALLHNHFQQWRREGRSGVWLHLPLPLAHLANEAVAAGFRLHHTSNEDMSIVLCAWLEEDAASRLPHYASHHVGVSDDRAELVLPHLLLQYMAESFSSAARTTPN